MITIISGTNRKNSKTLIVAKAYEEILRSSGTECQIFSLEELPLDFAFSYLSDPKSDEIDQLMNKYIRSATKFVALIPEYQGTFPGIFKLFLDSVHPRDLENKKIALVGISSGRAGNLRGLDHLTNALHYLKMHVLHNKLPISKISELISKDYKLVDEETRDSLKKQAEQFLKY
ncbi:MAG: NAD(P)H-dependent oxidoreductase [Bacteroidetes bacterium]|jgi:NAD(P)H-dependent FMN reductase|nr:NAD(P)H-dependent oxidoreductase [Bacteroidota bacterium]